MNILAIDAGSSGGGNAFAFGVHAGAYSELIAVFTARPHELRAAFKHLPAVNQAVVEKPQADGRTKNVSAKSTISLAWAGGIAVGFVLARCGCPVREVTPTRWKGSEAKPLQHRRLWKLLTSDERVVLGGDETWAAIEAACERGGLSRWSKPGAAYYGGDAVHNVLDAAALWAWQIGRLK